MKVRYVITLFIVIGVALLGVAATIAYHEMQKSDDQEFIQKRWQAIQEIQNKHPKLYAALRNTESNKERGIYIDNLLQIPISGLTDRKYEHEELINILVGKYKTSRTKKNDYMRFKLVKCSTPFEMKLVIFYKEFKIFYLYTCKNKDSHDYNADTYDKIVGNCQRCKNVLADMFMIVIRGSYNIVDFTCLPNLEIFLEIEQALFAKLSRNDIRLLYIHKKGRSIFLKWFNELDKWSLHSEAIILLIKTINKHLYRIANIRYEAYCEIINLLIDECKTGKAKLFLQLHFPEFQYFLERLNRGNFSEEKLKMAFENIDTTDVPVAELVTALSSLDKKIPLRQIFYVNKDLLSFELNKILKNETKEFKDKWMQVFENYTTWL